MKLNNKGFAITAVLYGLLILFVILVGSYLTVLSVRKSRTDNLLNDMEEDYLENASSNQEENNNPGNETRTIYTVTLNSNTIPLNAGTTVLYFVKEENKWYSDGAATIEVSYITCPNKIDKVFDGYYTSSNCDGNQIIRSDGRIVSNDINDSVEIKACWRENGTDVLY